mgnify:FL=1
MHTDRALKIAVRVGGMAQHDKPVNTYVICMDGCYYGDAPKATLPDTVVPATTPGDLLLDMIKKLAATLLGLRVVRQAFAM